MQLNQCRSSEEKTCSELSDYFRQDIQIESVVALFLATPGGIMLVLNTRDRDELGSK